PSNFPRQARRPFVRSPAWYRTYPVPSPDQDIALAYVAGRAAWPNLAVSVDAFRHHVVDRLRLSPASVVPRAADLYLVIAVLEGADRALPILDERLARAAGVVARIDGAPAFVDEVRQELRVKLLAGPEPRLRSYAGIGALFEWLRVAALRTAINLKRSDRLL